MLAVWDPLSAAPLPCTLAWYAGRSCLVCWLGFIYGNSRVEIDCVERQCMDEGGSQHMLSPVSVRGSFCVLREGLGHSTSSVRALRGLSDGMCLHFELLE